MQFYLFNENSQSKKPPLSAIEISALLEIVAAETNTSDLVVSVYFIRHSRWFGGSAFVRQWLKPDQFRTTRGNWKFTRNFPIPQNLPDRYKLIRLLPTRGANHPVYPLRLNDSYGWEFLNQNFTDHLALLFAHELHHFRRYHLGLHPGEGERSANQWALAHVKQLGFNVVGKKRTHNRPNKTSLNRFFSRIAPDPYLEFRTLTGGNRIYIRYDPHGRYDGTIATVERPLRANSKRLVIRTHDTKVWRWPMEWLQPISV